MFRGGVKKGKKRKRGYDPHTGQGGLDPAAPTRKLAILELPHMGPKPLHVGQVGESTNKTVAAEKKWR